MTPLDQAHSKHDELRAKLERGKAALEKNKAHRLELAFAAQTGDDAAKKTVADLAREAGHLADDVESLTAALAEADRRVKAAEAAVRDFAERDKATQALAMIDAFRKRGAALDTMFDAVIAGFAEIDRDFRALSALGFPPTTMALVEVHLKNAAQTKLQTIGLQSRFLAPHERRNFCSAIEGWAAKVESKANLRLSAAPPGEKPSIKGRAA